jgi:hypothetical protein
MLDEDDEDDDELDDEFVLDSLSCSLNEYLGNDVEDHVNDVSMGT